MQARARQKLESLRSCTLEQQQPQGREPTLCCKTVQGQQQRDLVIKLSWQGEADLDLKVKEPSGSVCSGASQTVRPSAAAS